MLPILEQRKILSDYEEFRKLILQAKQELDQKQKEIEEERKNK